MSSPQVRLMTAVLLATWASWAILLGAWALALALHLDARLPA